MLSTQNTFSSSTTHREGPTCTSQSGNGQCHFVQGEIETFQTGNKSMISSEEIMNQVQSVLINMNSTLVKEGSVLSVAFVGAALPTSPPLTQSASDANSGSFKSNNAAIAAGAGAFFILISATMMGIMKARRNKGKSLDPSGDSSVEDEEKRSEDESTCSSGTRVSPIRYSMTFTDGRATAADSKSSVGGSDENDVNHVILLNDNDHHMQKQRRPSVVTATNDGYEIRDGLEEC